MSTIAVVALNADYNSYERKIEDSIIQYYTVQYCIPLWRCDTLFIQSVVQAFLLYSKPYWARSLLGMAHHMRYDDTAQSYCMWWPILSLWSHSSYHQIILYCIFVTNFEVHTVVHIVHCTVLYDTTIWPALDVPTLQGPDMKAPEGRALGCMPRHTVRTVYWLFGIIL